MFGVDDLETHSALLDPAAERGTSLIETVRAAAEALRRQDFAHHVTEQPNALRAAPGAWADHLAEAASSHISDGVA